MNPRRVHAPQASNIQVGVRESTLQTRAAAVLRNLSHNPKNHGLLINAGAVDALVDVMRMEKVEKSRGRFWGGKGLAWCAPSLPCRC